MRLKSFLLRFPWIPFTFIFAILVVWGALSHPLWGDEAETALFAQSILKHGVPYGWDGTNIMGIQNAVVLNEDLVNYKSPWAQYYLVALSFLIFPDNSFTARLPFIILGTLIIPALYFLAVELFKSKRVATLSVAIASVAVPFVLFVYQARYYSLAILMAIIFSYSALKITEKKYLPKILFVVSGTLFFYGNYMVFVSFFAAFFIAISITFLAAYAEDKKKIYLREWKKLAIMYVVLAIPIALFAFPWVYLLSPFSSEVMPSQADSNANITSLLYYFLDGYFKYNYNNVFPLVFIPLWIVVIVKRVWEGKYFAPVLLIGLIPFIFLMIMAFFTSILLVETTFNATRYTMVAAPFFFLTSAYLIYELINWKAIVGWVVFFVYISTTIFTLQFPRVFLAEYISEVFDPRVNPDAEVAKFLQENARDGDTVFVSIDRDHYPLMFHLGSKVKFVDRITLSNPQLFPENRGVLPSYLYAFTEKPDWIVMYGLLGNDGTFSTFDFRPPPEGIDLKNEYEETVLPVYFGSDISRPEIEARSFQKIAPFPEEMVYIYKKKSE